MQCFEILDWNAFENSGKVLKKIYLKFVINANGNASHVLLVNSF